MNGDFVGRNTSGVPTSGQNLGTTAIPWGTVRAGAIVLNGDPIDASQITSPPNRIISGKTRTTSNQPQFITPNGAAASFLLAASATNLVLDINGTSVTVNTDITKSGLTTAPSSLNTCLVNDTEAAAQADTRMWGNVQHRKEIIIDTVGTNISNLIGKYATFKIGTEYFFAFVKNATTLSKCMRGYFYNSSLAPLNRVTFSNNDTITLMSTGWVFVENNGTTVDVSYNNPIWGYTAPSSPATGDYWYDQDNQVWKRYDGASFAIINRTFVGMVVIDSSNCVAARCTDFYAAVKSDLFMDVEVQTVEIVRAKHGKNLVQVMGRQLLYGPTSGPSWNMTTDLATSADMYNASEQASTMYYLYLSDEGKSVISDIEPYYRPDLEGYYHPHNTWRCVAKAFNGSGSDIANAGMKEGGEHRLLFASAAGHGATDTMIRYYTAPDEDFGTAMTWTTGANSGTIVKIEDEGWYNCIVGDIRAAGGFAAAGISENTSQKTTVVYGVTRADVLIMQESSAAAGICVSRTKKLKIGTLLRHHTAGNENTGALPTYFKIERVR